jgi:hypothetical protein
MILVNQLMAVTKICDDASNFPIDRILTTFLLSNYDLSHVLARDGMRRYVKNCQKRAWLIERERERELPVTDARSGLNL